MRVRFGLHFDGLQPQPPANATGVATLGPAGLLGVLENRLGLPSPVAHPSEAAFAYLQCLRETSAPSRFFHRSLHVDPVNVARTLLDWRARWYEAGWDGTFPDTFPTRLADMAAVETFARGRVPPCPGERLRRIEETLGERSTQIDCVELHTSPAALPHAWQRVLEALPCELAPGLDPVPAGPEGSDLSRVQAGLLSMAGGRIGTDHGPPTHPHGSFSARVPVRARAASRQVESVEATTRRRTAAVKQGDQPGTTGRERIRLQGDGSLILMRSASRDLSAEAVAECVLDSGRPADTLLVAERDGIILDNALERVGLPRCGFRYHTRFRGATQVLSLCLALMWAPVSPRRMLQFLLHPTGPLSQGVRARLAGAVAASPGVGGPEWDRALAGIEKTLRERDGTREKDVERQRSDIAFWLDGQRHDPREGAPIDEVIARTQRVSNWVAGRLATVDTKAETVLFGVARAQAEALLAELARRRDEGTEYRIPRLELERMVDEVTTDTPDPATFAEAGRPRATTSPAAVTDRWPVVVWWDVAASQAAVSYPWSRRELAALREAGVKLPEVDEVLRHRSREWLRPVLNATERLVLVTHEGEGGKHPISTQIESCFDGIEEAETKVEPALLDGNPTLAPLPVRTRALPLHPLPAPRRWWTLPEDCVLAPDDVESYSYSSLSKLCDYPHEWVLHYAARLRAGRAAEVSDGPLLYGTLGHRLIEEFFRAHDDWRSVPIRDARAWVRAKYPGLVEREGAVLLEPGRGIERESVGDTLERAVVRLLAHLRAAGIKHVEPEVCRRAPFAEGCLTGVIDLLLTDANGDHVVVDVKWGSPSYRRNLLVENRALQLATYAYLQKTRGAGRRRWPEVAFFILSTGELLANDDSRFPDAVVAPSASGEDIPDLWRRLGVTYRWRWEQLLMRRIEIVTDLTEPDEHSTPPDSGLAAVDDGDPYDDFGRLTGWEPFR